MQDNKNPMKIPLIAIALIFAPLAASANDEGTTCDGECVQQCIRAHNLAPGAIGKCADIRSDTRIGTSGYDTSWKIWSRRERCAVDGTSIRDREVVLSSECNLLFQQLCTENWTNRWDGRKQTKCVYLTDQTGPS